MLLIAHIAATLVMVGVIWTVQLVHYPLFAEVGEATFVSYHARHVSAITLIVGPAMLIELGTGFMLLFEGPDQVPGWVWMAGLGLIGVAWLTTGLVSVPMHDKLAGGFDAGAHATLVSTNWARTIAWTLRGAGLVWIMSMLMKNP